MPKDRPPRIVSPEDFLDDGDNREDEKPWGDGDSAVARTTRGEADRTAPAGPDRGRRKGPRRPAPLHHREASFEEGGRVWIWGIHAGGAALANPSRTNREVFVTRNAAHRVGLNTDALEQGVTLVEPRDIDRKLPEGAVHQGLAVLADPLQPTDLADIVIRPEKPVVILDQVTDPQNVGAILRSAAAFGFGAVILQTRNAPALGGVLAKAATGAIETLAEVRVVNLSRAIEELRDAGWRVVGLDGKAEATIGEAFVGRGPLAVVLGAEGAGLRQGVAEACSALGRIPMAPGADSLNVSNAAAIAFYEAARRSGDGRVQTPPEN
jgi:23S rRNA (guanosine2251-2'-O)-methyltransferase